MNVANVEVLPVPMLPVASSGVRCVRCVPWFAAAWRGVGRRGGGCVAGGIADYAAENTGRRGRSQYPGVISHTFPQFRETPLRAAHPRRAGGIGTAAASRGRFDSTVRKTCAIIRSASGVFSQNHARRNRLCGLCALCVRFILRGLCVRDSPSLASLGSPLREGAGFAGTGLRLHGHVAQRGPHVLLLPFQLRNRASEDVVLAGQDAGENGLERRRPPSARGHASSSIVYAARTRSPPR